jgi:hypothetical protein
LACFSLPAILTPERAFAPNDLAANSLGGKLAAGHFDGGTSHEACQWGGKKGHHFSYLIRRSEAANGVSGGPVI